MQEEQTETWRPLIGARLTDQLPLEIMLDEDRITLWLTAKTYNNTMLLDSYGFENDFEQQAWW